MAGAPSFSRYSDIEYSHDASGRARDGMANRRHVEYALDREKWAEFRSRHPRTRPDLRGAELEEARLEGDFSGVRFDGARLKHASMPFQLNGATFSRANLGLAHLQGQADVRDEIGRRDTIFRDARMTDSTLRNADFTNADFSRADLRGAMFEGSLLTGANFTGANLAGSRFDRAILTQAVFSGADLKRASFGSALCEWTRFDGVDLSSATGLERIEHRGPSSISVATIYRSGGRIPDSFLSGAHPDAADDVLRKLRDSLRSLPFEYYSCFISYDHKDAVFVGQLGARMRRRRIGFWIDSASLRAGERFAERIGEAIGRHDRFVVVLSKASVRSDWVRREVELARVQKADDILPIRLDDTVLAQRDDTWAELASSRHISDFSRWPEPAVFKRQFELLADALRRG
jgi:uncharacterized protein YjbI with pentapeptide repeats